MNDRSNMIQHAVSLAEHDERLDAGVRVLEPIARRLDGSSFGPLLRGEWLGHAVHPMLTDLPIGCWTSSFVLDVVGGKRARAASRRLLGLGVLAVVPTAAAGLVDWLQLSKPTRRRAGVVHAVSNTVATACYVVSWRCRGRGRHAAGVTWGALGGAAATVGGYLGGHLAFGSDDSEATEDTEPDQAPELAPDAAAARY
jgi:uncharacterized membrane protein